MNPARATADRVLEAVAKVPVLSHLDDRRRRRLARLCTLKSFEPGDELYEEGAMGLRLFIVVSGAVRIHKSSGDRQVELGKVLAGGILGQVALLDDQPRGAAAVALEPSECLLLTRDSFSTLVRKDPQIAWCLTQGLAERVRDLQQLAVEAALARDERLEEGAPPADAGSAELEDEESDLAEEDEDSATALGSAILRMMRVQFGLLAGGARGMSETAKALETFLDSLGEEMAFTGDEDWSDLIRKFPQATWTAVGSAIDQWDKVPEEMLDAYARYGEGEE